VGEISRDCEFMKSESGMCSERGFKGEDRRKRGRF
jgi:hypothetical protein